MIDELIPDDVRQFILGKIDSVAQMEGLLLLRSNPEMEWGIEALAERLYIDRNQAATVLAHLYAQNFLSVKEAKGSDIRVYSYQPASPELGQMVDRVAETYSKYLVPITNLIHSKPQTRVQQFADAFKLRKRKDK